MITKGIQSPRTEKPSRSWKSDRGGARLEA
jgi:hypothetical protein